MSWRMKLNFIRRKQSINDYLDIFQFWFRDVLMFKATREIDNLVFKQEINYIREQASQRSYENLEKSWRHWKDKSTSACQC